MKRKTAKSRLGNAVKRVARWWCRGHRHEPLAVRQAGLNRRLYGYYNYFGITGNSSAMLRFLWEVERLWRKWLSRRLHHGRMTWVVFKRLLLHYPLARPRVVHSIYHRVANP